MTGRFALLTTFGLGHLRPAPGTWGSLPPVVLAGVMIAAGCGPDMQPLVYHGVLGAVMLVFSYACIAYGDHGEARYLGKDPSNIVADETAGQCIPLAFLPATVLDTPVAAAFTLGYAFVAFRLLDIVKPFPARRLQEVPGGWGILLDDLVAGVYALAIMQAVTRLAV